MFELPESIVIEGTEYPIETSWRVWAEVGALLSKEKSAASFGKAIVLVFKEKKLPPLVKAMPEIISFYQRGKKAAEDKKSEEPVFDLVYDFGLVSAAFFGQYGIDLRKCNMHWWEFWELFEGLKSEEKIIKVIGYRGCKLNEIKNKEEKKHIAKMKELYKLPIRKALITSEDIGFELGKLF